MSALLAADVQVSSSPAPAAASASSSSSTATPIRGGASASAAAAPAPAPAAVAVAPGNAAQGSSSSPSSLLSEVWHTLRAIVFGAKRPTDASAAATPAAAVSTEDDNICAICQDELQPSSGAGGASPTAVAVITLKCNPKHRFHAPCIEGWCRRSSTCPYDRTPVRAEDLVPALSRFDWSRFYVSQFLSGSVAGSLVYVYVAENVLRGSWSVSLAKLLVPLVSPEVARSLVQLSMRALPLPVRARARDLVALLIEAELLEQYGVDDVWQYFAISYLSRSIGSLSNALIRICNVGYSYNLLHSVKKTRATSWVHGAGFFSGLLIGGYYLREGIRHILARGYAPLWPLLAVLLEPRPLST